MQAHAQSKEFFFPPPKNIEDLESLDKMGLDKYVVDVVMDISVISAADQHATLQEIFNEITRKKSPSHINDSEKFDTLYAFIKGLRVPGLVGRESRQIMAENLSAFLRKLCKMLAAYFASGKTSEIELVRRVGRSSIKMYCFLLTQLLCSTVVDDANGAEGLVVTTQAIRTKRKRGAAAGGRAATEENDSGIEIATREVAVAGFSDVLSPDIEQVWNDRVVDESVIHALLRTVLHMITQKSSVDGDDNPVAMSLRLLLANLVKRYTCAFVDAEEAKARDGHPIVAVSPVDVIVTPLIEHMMRSASIAKFCSKLLVLIDKEDAAQTWSNAFLGMFLEAVASAAINDVVGDGPAAKNIAAFIEEHAHCHATATHRFSHFFLPSLCSESYEIRKGAMTALSEMILQKVQSGAAPGGGGGGGGGGAGGDGAIGNSAADEVLRDKYLEDLWMRMRDVNNFARAHCIKLWTALVEAKAVPRRYYLRVVEEAVGRLNDRYLHARRGAMQLLQACMKRHWFHNVLSLTLLESKLQQHTVATRERYTAMGLNLDDALPAARAAYAPMTDADRYLAANAAGMDPAAITRQTTDPFAGVGDGEISLPSARQSTASAFDNTRMSVNISGASNASGVASDPDVARIAFYEAAVRFVKHLHNALTYASGLLDSKTTQDVTEAMEFVVICAEYRIDTAPPVILKMLVMIYIHDPAIQQAVCDAFLFMFFRQLTKEQAIAAGQANMSMMARNLVRVQKLLHVLASANVGEASAIERIIATIRARSGSANFITESFVDAVWGVVDGSLDDGNGTPTERRLALRLYTMLASAIPRDVGTRRDAILDVMQRNATDNVLLAHAFTALQKESFNKAFVAIQDPADPAVQAEHPVMRLAVHHLCRPTSQLGTWTQLADAVITAVHVLHATPITVYQRVVAFLAHKYHQTSDPAVMTQLFVVVGQTAIKHLVSIDCYERAQMKKLDDPRGAAAESGAAGGNTSVDVMHKELGMGTNEFARHELLEHCARSKLQMLDDAQSIWGRIAPLVVAACKKPADDELFARCPLLRVSAVMTLTNLMITHEGFCEKNLKLLFTLLKNDTETWEVKTNIVVALGDLCCVHPNSLQPYMKQSSSGFYALLADSDRRVRATTVQVCTHLVLNDMLRVHDHLHTIVRLVADPDEAIAANAIMFVKHLAIKCKQNIGNLIPPLVPQLAHVMEKEKFEMALCTLLEKVEKDKPTESVIDKLCQRFGPYSERAGKAQTLARRLAFCLSELNFTTERAMKKLMAENTYQCYKQWLRDPEVLAHFQQIAIKARRAGMGVAANAERRDRAAIDEWEQRVINDANLVDVAPGALGERGTRVSGGADVAGEMLADGEGDGALGADAADNGLTAGTQASQYRLLDPTSSDSDEGDDNTVGARAAAMDPSQPTRTERHVQQERARRSAELRRAADRDEDSPFAAGSDQDGGDDDSEDELPAKRARGGGATKSAKPGPKVKKEAAQAQQRGRPKPKAGAKRPRVKREESGSDSSEGSDGESNSSGSSSASDSGSESDDEAAPARGRGARGTQQHQQRGGRGGSAKSSAASGRGRRQALQDRANSSD